MFGLSSGQIVMIVLVGVFVLGPQRIPTAVTWLLHALRKARTMASGAQAQLHRELGPEIDELRRQVADLQSLKELQELRDLHPQRLFAQHALGAEFRGGLTGFLRSDTPPTAPPEVVDTPGSPHSEPSDAAGLSSDRRPAHDADAAAPAITAAG